MKFDEKKESVICVCGTGGGYGWGTLFYDTETGDWFEHSYHCGGVDLSEDYDDGVSPVFDERYILDAIINRNEIFMLFRFYEILNAEKFLPDVLEKLQRTHGGGIEPSGFQESPYHNYYLFKNGDYAIFFSGVFYSPMISGKFEVNYNIINRIIWEKDTVLLCRYDFGEKVWRQTLLSEDM